MKKKNFFLALLSLLASILAGCAAYFSVFGLSQLFAGAFIASIIVFGVLEACKLGMISYLNQYWFSVNKKLKTYMVPAVIALMLLTSVGIFGFLYSAYSDSYAKMEGLERTVELIEKKKEIKQEEKKNIESVIESKNERIKTLNDLRRNQERRLDSLYMRGWIKAAKQTEDVIQKASDEINKCNFDIEEQNKKIIVINDSISSYEIKKTEVGQSAIAREIGPLKYLAKGTGLDMDTVVKILIILIMFVFDPLAVALLIAANNLSRLKSQKEEEENTDEYVADEKGNFRLSQKIKEIKDKLSGKKEGEESEKEDFLKYNIADDYYSYDEDKLPIETFSEAVVVEPIAIPEKSETTQLEEDGRETEIIDESFEEVKTPIILPEKTESSLNEGDDSNWEEDVEQVKKEDAEQEITKQTGGEEAEQMNSTKISEHTKKQPTIKRFAGIIVPDVFTSKEFERQRTKNTKEEFKKEQKTEKIETFQDELKEDVPIITQQEAKRLSGLYIDFLKVMFDEGALKVGDKVLPYKEFKASIDKVGTKYNEKELNDFFVICNLLNITQMKDGVPYINKDYLTSIYLIRNI